ncbi:MAG: patatin-like phospholipase family protein, partial [Deinococcales bacterium]
ARIAELLGAAPRSPVPRGPVGQRLRALLDVAAYVESDLLGMGRESTDRLRAGIERWVGRQRIESLPRRFGAVAADVRTGEEVLLDRGPLATAVGASAALPGVFLPVPWRGRLLMDGGVVDNLPVQPARVLGGDVVLAVSVVSGLAPDVPRTGVGLLARADQLGRAHTEKLALASADVGVCVALPDGVGLFDFHRASDIIAAGRAAMQAALPALREALARRSASV